MSYETLLKQRVETIEDIHQWYWIQTDTGAWDGPKTDWIDNHSHKWFTNVKTWDACVQAGGCQGVYPRLLSKRFKHVYTFEPDPLNFHVLVNNCQFDNIHKFNAALGESHEFVRIDREGSMTNVGMHRTAPDEQGWIPTLRIDDLNLPSCGLIALDMESAEFPTLKGATETIQRFHPVITCEMPKDEIRQWLTGHGYREIAQSVSDTVFSVD